MPDDATPQRDYRDTVFLPRTPFPMRAGLPQREPAILDGWAGQDIYAAMRAARQAGGAPLFVLHDGPPYANGAIHIGHALNKILKDFVVRSRFLLGFDVDYVPGWDCHGLPIEWKIEEEFRKSGRRKDEVPPAEFRARCREYAARWMQVQKLEFQRLGVLGDWEGRYATMDHASEAAIVGEFHKFLMSGQLYRGSKPVMWSPVERTALADAEVEYHDHVSPTIWVKFPVRAYEEERYAHSGDERGGNVFRLQPNDASVVIWTTTPWTIPGNRAIAFGPGIAYGLYEIEAMETGLEFEPWAKPGDRLILADKLAEEVRKAARIARWRRAEDIDPEGLICRHPLYTLDEGYGFEVPLLAGEHVTEDAGTGFVHTAPGHGAEDYAVWLKSGRRDIPETVDADGAVYPHVPLFGGLKVLETEGKKAGRFGAANPAVIDKLVESGALLARGRLEHSYPHSWRSKAPVIFRNTPQWFIRLDQPLAEGASLRDTALAAIDATAFFPEAGRARIRGMVEGRPDWLISRQRAWGTPLAMFVDKASGEPLRDEAVNARIGELIAAEGADAWFTRPAADFFGGRDPDAYEKIDDILDVWFDSGSTHAFTLEGRPKGENASRWPADLYLEGSDQHRGWFQSSLLESCGTRGRAPYDAVLTHGFTLDEAGEKMSKSRGNTTEPQAIIRESGADILRLWAAMVDYSDDQRIGKQVLQTTADAYRKLRNTVRYLLGALDGFTEAERVGPEQMPPLERFILHRLWELDRQVRAAYERYDFKEAWRAVAEFSSGDLSALYFDIRKDALYCDAPASVRRRACRTVMDLVFERLTAWLSPLIPFTMEEAWQTRFEGAPSNLLRVIPETPAEWRDDAEAERWKAIRTNMSTITLRLEEHRTNKELGGALEADVTLTVSPGAYEAMRAGELSDQDWADIFRTSIAHVEAKAELQDEARAAAISLAQGEKCARCWRILPEVTPPENLCLRCRDVLTKVAA